MAFAQYPFGYAPFASSQLQSPNELIEVTGVEASAELGAITVVTDQILAQTGVVGTGAVGAVSIYAAANLTLTGTPASALLGSVSLVTNNILAQTGVVGTSTLDTVIVEAKAEVYAVGVVGTCGAWDHIANN